MAVGGTTDRQKPAILSGGKRAETLSFFLYIHNYPSFFRHINSVIDKTAGAVFGVQGSPCPSESPIKFRVSLNGMGLLCRETPGKNV